MIAAITLKMLDPFGTGKLVLFQVTYHKVVSSFINQVVIDASFRIGTPGSSFLSYFLASLEYVIAFSNIW